MKRDKIEYLLRSLGAERISQRTNAQGTMVTSSCPLSRWRHLGGRDSHPSFAVFVADDDESLCKCFSCKYFGNLKNLLWAMRSDARKHGYDQDYSKYVTYVHDNEHKNNSPVLEKLKTNAGFYSQPSSGPSDDVLKGKDYSDPISVADALSPLPDQHADIAKSMHDWLDPESIGYLLNKRKLSRDSIEKWGLGWHPIARRISIPQYDYNHRLMNIAGRHLPSILDDPDWDPPPWLHAAGFRKEFFLFGEDRLVQQEPGKRTGFLVEGMFDVIYLTEHEVPNVTGMLGSHLGRYQIEKMVKWFDHVIVVPDGDKAGRDAAQKVTETLGQRIYVSVYPTPDNLDPDELSDEQISELKSMIQK